jgi:DNA primase
MPSIDYRQVRSAVNMRQVLELIGFEASRRHADEWRGPCPLHSSRSPYSRSFAANVRKNTFRCFRCGAVGNHLDLWILHTELPLYEATRELCRRLGVPLPILSPPIKTGQTRSPGRGAAKDKEVPGSTP